MVCGNLHTCTMQWLANMILLLLLFGFTVCEGLTATCAAAFELS